MPTLKIDLQEGFDSDHVVVVADGRQVYDRQGVRTRMQISLADSLETETGPQASIVVRLPEKGIEASATVNVEETPNIGVAVEGGEVVFKQPPEGQVMFGYL